MDRKAFAAGKHVLAEKPLTTSFGDTARLADQAFRSGLVLRENFAFVRHPQHLEVRRRLTEGDIGELRWLSATFAVPSQRPGDIRY